MLSLGSASVSQSGAPRVKKRSSTYAIHRSQVAPARRLVVEQPDAAAVALALLDQGLDEDAEEAGDVGLADQQVDGQLHASLWMRAMHSARRRSLISRARASAQASAIALRVSRWLTEAAVPGHSPVPSMFHVMPRADRRSSTLHPLIHPLSVSDEARGVGGSGPSRASSESRRSARDLGVAAAPCSIGGRGRTRPTTRLSGRRSAARC